MISVSSSFKSPASLFVQPAQRSTLKKLKKIGNQELIRISRGKGLSCRSELAQDAPFAAAIGACVLTSLVFPISYDDDENGGGGAIDSTDARFVVMGIISFIPYFNWMSWVFAWLDSDDSWLPIAGIVICIIHIQLEASIKNGDINGIQFFGRALKLFSSFKEEEDAKFQPHDEIPNKGRNKKQMDPPSARNVGDGFELGESETPRKHVDDPRHLEERSDGDGKENKIN